MLQKILIKLLKIIFIFALGGIVVLFFEAMQNLTILLITSTIILFLCSCLVVRMHRLGDRKKGTQIIRGRIYAEHPFSSHLDGRQVVYEYYAEHVEIENHKGKSARIIDFREERIAQRIYLRDDFGKISLLQDQLKIHKNKGRIWPDNLQEANAYWHARSDGNVKEIEHDQFLHGQPIVAVGQLCPTKDGGRMICKSIRAKDQPYFIASTGQFHGMQRGRRIIYSFWSLLLLMAAISASLYYIPAASFAIIENFAMTILGDHWQSLLSLTLSQPREVIVIFFKYGIASVPFIILIFFKTPIFQRIILPIIYSNLSWLVLMLYAFGVFHIFLLNITIMWLMLGMIYCVILIYLLAYINYLRTMERQDINHIQ